MSARCLSCNCDPYQLYREPFVLGYLFRLERGRDGTYPSNFREACTEAPNAMMCIGCGDVTCGPFSTPRKEIDLYPVIYVWVEALRPNEPMFSGPLAFLTEEIARIRLPTVHAFIQSQLPTSPPAPA